MLPIYFAPLQGYTEAPYRRIHNLVCGGISSYYSPFIRIEKGEIRNKDIRDIAPNANSSLSCTPQAIASNSAELAQIISLTTSNGYSSLDINMGCPYPMQTRYNRGAGILPHPSAVQDICDLIRQHPEISFSIKMRLGMESNLDWQNIISILNDTPLTHITMHPRIGKQMYKGAVDMEMFRQFLSESRHPVIYNGDITSIDDIHNIENRFPGIKGIMIGRGLLSRPTLAREYTENIRLSNEQTIPYIIKMHNALVEYYSETYPDENQRLGKLKAFWEYLESTIGRKTWKTIMKATKWDKYIILTTSLTTR